MNTTLNLPLRAEMEWFVQNIISSLLGPCCLQEQEQELEPAMLTPWKGVVVWQSLISMWKDFWGQPLKAFLIPECLLQVVSWQVKEWSPE